MTKFSIELHDNSKMLLKVLTCVWRLYLIDNIKYTQKYQANPIETIENPNYTKMLEELDANFLVITASYILQKLNICKMQSPTYIELIVSDAYGNIVYFKTNAPVTFETSNNTFNNAATNSIAHFNLATTKPVQRLNRDECLENTYQINPIYLKDNELDNKFLSNTIASIVARTGCAGIANTGFIRLSIIADSNCFPVPLCMKEACK